MPLTDNTPNPNILSLFDGMSCGQIALRGLGVSCGKYYASEIDKHAIAQTQLNFPDTVQLGDVTRWREWSIDWASIDLLLAGSPCQGFSFAGKQLAFDDPRSQLFFVFIDILNHIRTFNPNVKFLLENVNMKRSHMAVINQYCGLFPVNINSALVSAQNRDRWYWSNIRTRQQGLFAEVHTDIPQPPDRGVFLKDILESDVDRKYYLSDKAVKYITNQVRLTKGFTQIDGDKTTPLLAAGTTNNTGTFIKVSTKGKVSPNQDKASCITGAGGHGAGNHSDMDCIMQLPPGSRTDDLICVAMRGRANGQQLKPNHTHKTNCLTSVQKDNLVIQINPSKESGGKQPYQGNRVYSDVGKYVALQTELRGNVEISDDKSRQKTIRRLTPTECSRLQTVPENYVWKCSETQVYRMLGNGWTILVIMWILSFSRWVTNEQRTEFNNKYFNQ